MSQASSLDTEASFHIAHEKFLAMSQLVEQAGFFCVLWFVRWHPLWHWGKLYKLLLPYLFLVGGKNKNLFSEQQFFVLAGCHTCV